MSKHLLDTVKKLHFIGIGGSGTFPMVEIFHQWGYEITGSDNNPGDTINREKALGIPVAIGHNKDNIKDQEAVIYSAAIPKTNPELIEAAEKGIPLIPRAEALGYLTEKYSNCICVSGTHGKTSTTAMLTQVLIGAGLDPTAVIGGRLPLIDGYGRVGKSDIMTCEACEYQDTYHALSSDISIILNVDEDHLEYFKTLDNIKKSFRKFAQDAHKVVLVNGDDRNTMDSVKGLEQKLITFGLASTNDYWAGNIQRLSPTITQFDFMKGKEKITTLEVDIPGEHHVLNALACSIAALYVGATPEKIAEHLPQFKGAGRRFERLGTVNGVHIVDDYAHHPVEIAATLKVAGEMGFNKVWAVHQPFTYSRTALLLKDFASALTLADHVVLSDIMGGREENTYSVYAEDLAALVPGSVHIPKFPEIAQYVLDHAQPNDLVLTLGCGDVYKCAHLMLELGNK